MGGPDDGDQEYVRSLIINYYIQLPTSPCSTSCVYIIIIGKAVTLVGVVLPRGELSISNGVEKTEEEERGQINGEETDKINGEERDRTIKSKTCGSSCKVGRELW